MLPPDWVHRLPGCLLHLDGPAIRPVEHADAAITGWRLTIVGALAAEMCNSAQRTFSTATVISYSLTVIVALSPTVRLRHPD